jgi:xylulokinase
MERYVLAVDHGTSGIKAAVVSERGCVVDFEFEPTSIRFLPGGGAEQDPEEWWDALGRASSRLVNRAAIPAECIAAVCVSSTFSTTVALGTDGAHLGNALTWMDSRGAPHVRRLMGGFPSLMGYNLRKAWTWIHRSGGAPSFSGKDDAAHVLFWKHEMPALYRQTRVFLPSKDYLNYRLTGAVAATHDSVHLFWVTDARNPDRVRYDAELIRLLGIDGEKLPPLRAPTDVLGPLTAEAASATGLPAGIPVVAGSPDHQCAMIGSGAVRDYETHLYVGTSSWIECPVPFKKTDVLHSIASFPCPLPGRYQCVNEQDLAGGALGFLADNLLFHRNPLVTVERPADPYDILDRLAGAVPAGSGKLLFTPWLNGERTPVDDPNLRGGFHNISTTSTLDDMVRAVMEGVAYNTRWSLRYVERFVGRKLSPLAIVGGGGRSDLWCRIFADVLDREIRRVRDPVQANARGAAFLAAVGLGWIRFEDIPSLVEHDRVYHPDPAHRAIYEELFGAFLEIHRQSRRLYRRLNRR